jgi:hypothetical protein
MAEKLPAPKSGLHLSFQQTEDEIINLISRLHHLRLASHPDVFECLWAAHVARVEEVESPLQQQLDLVPTGPRLDEKCDSMRCNTAMEIEGQSQDQNSKMEDETIPSTSCPASTTLVASSIQNDQVTAISIGTAADVSNSLRQTSDEAGRKRAYPNYSGEPFNTSGNPISPSLTARYLSPPRLPQVMSIWIMTSVGYASRRHDTYHHPAVPVREQDMLAFFSQMMERAGCVAEEDVKGYALSYGWCDAIRWIEKTVGQGCRGIGDGSKAGESEGERLGWEVFQRDLVDAAKARVVIWRMKVLVVSKCGIGNIERLPDR